mgnify:CR=1 FL=1
MTDKPTAPAENNDAVVEDVVDPQTEDDSTPSEEKAPDSTAKFEELKEAFYEVADAGAHMQSFMAPASGTEYKLTPLNFWTPRQNKAMREIYKRAEAHSRESHVSVEGDKPDVGLGQVLQALLEAELWCDAFAIIYLPVDAARYVKEDADAYKDDFLDLTNEQALGALAFFIASSASSIPNGILGFFKDTPIATAIGDWQKRTAGDGSETST